LVKAGRNIIAIRNANTAFQGGLKGDAKNGMFIELAETANSPKISLEGEWNYKYTHELPTFNVEHPLNKHICSILYNSSIQPFVGMPIRGVIWYQGESNSDRAYQYRELMMAMMSSWRNAWKDQDIFFIQTQLANFQPRYDSPRENAWAELRESQFFSAKADKKCGMAVTIDIGDPATIHPANKQDVGKRLALQALHLVYGTDIPFEGPVYKSMKIENGKIRISFDSVFGGLVARGDSLKGFAIAGADKKFVWAEAKIAGNDVIVWSDKIQNPISVRYGWDINPNLNLYNSEGLPACPFRTDSWDGITKDRK
jgi:sialate O-acetylesterase